MTKMFLSAMNGILIILEVIFAMLILLPLINVAKDPGGTFGFIGLVLVFMVPTIVVRRYILQKIKGGPVATELKEVEVYNRDGILKKVKPEFEIKYRNSEGVVTVRKIALLDIVGAGISAFCFLRNDVREFYCPHIQECIDLSTGELVTENLMVFFVKRRYPRKRLARVFEYDEWCEIPYVEIPDELPEGLLFFNIDKRSRARIVTYRDGVIEDDFLFGKVLDSQFDADKYYVQIIDSNGEERNVGFSKILSVEGGSFLDFVLAELSSRKGA